MKDIELAPATLSVWAGEGESLAQGATQVPIVYSAAYGYPDVESWLDVALGRRPGHIYSRNTNPTVHAFEQKVRILEGAAAATSFSTGMAAVSNTLFALLAPGDRVVSVKDTYGGTNQMFVDFLPRIGVQVDLCDTSDHEQIEAAIGEGCRLVYLESPTNPTLKVMDIARLSAAAHEAGALVVADNTFATPINQNPLATGLDVVIHSATKYLNGHSDLNAGAVIASGEIIARIRPFAVNHGGMLDAHTCYMLERGLKTLALRVERQNENAGKLARWLQKHPAVARVNYPGLPDHPDHAVAARQMRGFGGMLSFELRDAAQAGAALGRFQLATAAVSLGGVETLVTSPAKTSHVKMTAAERAAVGISDALLRVSTGIEDADDLIADFEQTLAAK